MGLSQSGSLKASRGAAAYSYRNGMGLLPSSEFYSIFDDFHQQTATNVPTGWAAAAIDTGATVVQLTTALTGGNTGVLLFSDATASEGAAIWLAKSFVPTVGKKFFMELRVQTDDVTDNIIQFGLSDGTVTTNPEDLWTTTSPSLITFGIQDGAGTLTMLADKSNTGSTLETGTRAMVANTWHTLGIFYDGSRLSGYLDGKLALSWSQAASTIPTGIPMLPFIGTLNGNGAGGNNNYVDYIRLVAER